MGERNTRIRISQLRGIISNKVEHNILLNAFRIAMLESTESHNMVDGIRDDFDDETGIDTGASTNESYDSVNDLYQPLELLESEIDYMEYSSDILAQSAYVTDAGAGIDSYTKLTLHGNGLDGSKSHTVTFGNNAQIDTAQYKIGSSSCYFDGTDDYISVLDHEDFNFGSGDFTIDTWVRYETLIDYVIACQFDSSNTDLSWMFWATSTTMYFRYSTDGTSYVTKSVSTDPDMVTGTWYHIAVARSGNNLHFFLDGAQQGATQDVTGVTLYNSTRPLYIGDRQSLDDSFGGWLDEFRISKGTARWTAGFTPQTSKYTSDQYTAILLHFEAPDASTYTYDSSGGDESGNNHQVTFNGNAQLDTAQYKFSGAGILFDGTGDYLSIPDSPDWNFGSGDFTIDTWVRFNVVGANRLCGQYIDGDNQLKLDFTSTNFRFWVTSGATTITDMQCAFSPTVDTWYHIAFVRSGDTPYMFIDGVSKTITEYTTISGKTLPDLATTFTVGRAEASGYFNGWIDEFRISKGIARWTSNFTPQTSEYTETPELQCYSEATIIQQGTYSLKVVAIQTDSLNDNLTKSGLSIDLTDMNNLKVYFRASRTGTNIQLQIHDSGGTTSTKDIVISSADTWEQTTWDISAIANVDKDDIDQIIIKITNADSANTIYVDDFKTVGLINNMTLISLSSTAEAQSDDARMVIFEEDVDSVTENTDIKAYVSRDGGTTWTQCTLSDEGDYETNKRVLSGTVDISAQPAGTSMEYKIETLNNKSLYLHGIGLLWS